MQSAPDETRFAEMVFPELANHYGTLYGGNALSLMGKAAYIAASRAARCDIVMASSDKIAFHRPARVGQLIELIARVTRRGRTSMTVSVEVHAETLATGERTMTMSGTFEMVAVDKEGRPTAIPTNKPDTTTPEKIEELPREDA
ncbi:acyl-CoA thioesterase [Oceanibaculum nanhaiense]|jgi:acyl-CoA hydrolase|uniref:acyl-CoA thioesterase n=2 Tax=Oceanibaculum nanhaiense TaxID=1909734 RepID=UPI000A364E43|nr:hotdog domain-containing protein [Oceanibaculum nanhaiense]MBC7135662.1 thioesterase family protein [Oceanibaculum nanhaiense]